MTGIQMLSDFFELDVIKNPTLGFLSIICILLSTVGLKDLCGLSNWEYNRIFEDNPEDGVRWHRSAKLAFNTIAAHMEKQNLDDCQFFISYLLREWLRNEYLMELGDEMESITGEDIIDYIDDEYEVSAEDLDIVGLLMFRHLAETNNPEAKVKHPVSKTIGLVGPDELVKVIDREIGHIDPTSLQTDEDRNVRKMIEETIMMNTVHN